MESLLLQKGYVVKDRLPRLVIVSINRILSILASFLLYLKLVDFSNRGGNILLQASKEAFTGVHLFWRALVRHAQTRQHQW
eukprot:2552082-Amphidinium_carterae.1